MSREIDRSDVVCDDRCEGRAADSRRDDVVEHRTYSRTPSRTAALYIGGNAGAAGRRHPGSVTIPQTGSTERQIAEEAGSDAAQQHAAGARTCRRPAVHRRRC